MWKTAQDKLAIDPKYHVPIFKINNSSSFFYTDILGIYQNNAMYINENVLNDLNYGVQKFVLLHEAAHHKYLDAFYKKIITFSVIIGGCLGASFIPIPTALTELQSGILKIIGSLGTLGTGFIIGKYLSYHNEQRADLEAAYALNCHRCTTNVRDDINNVSHNYPEFSKQRLNSGYLSGQELDEIAQKHKRDGKICQHHSHSLLHNINWILGTIRPK
jgi:hypothetical protein